MVQQHVADDPAAEAADQRHQHDAGASEVAVMIGATCEQRAVERVRGGGYQVDRREVAREPPVAEPVNAARERQCDVEVHHRASSGAAIDGYVHYAGTPAAGVPVAASTASRTVSKMRSSPSSSNVPA